MRLVDITARFLILTGAALLWLGLGLGGLLAGSSPARAGSEIRTAPGLIPGRPAAQTGLQLSIDAAAQTRASADGSVVYNGDEIEYILTIHSSGSGEVNRIEIENPLPLNVLDEVECQPTDDMCQVLTTVITPTEGITIAKSSRVAWTITETLTADDFPLELRFWGRVVCQGPDKTFNSVASIFYQTSDGATGFQFSPPLDTIVQRIPIEQQDDRLIFSGAPEFCSQAELDENDNLSWEGPFRNTTDMDWGDFDNDGDLDVAFVSPDLGVFVYRNNDGALERFWRFTPEHVSDEAAGVLWGNFEDEDDYLELLLSGGWDEDDSELPGGGFMTIQVLITSTSSITS